MAEGPAVGAVRVPVLLLLAGVGAGGGPITEEADAIAALLEASPEGEVMERPEPPIGENPGEP